MTKLKTLKDLTKWNQKGVKDIVVRVTDLRNEAIKWIKELRNNDKIKFNYEGFCLICQKHLGYVGDTKKISCDHYGDDILYDGCYECEGDITHWIDCLKFIYNITEEELK